MDNCGPEIIHHFQAKSHGRFFVDISEKFQPYCPDKQL